MGARAQPSRAESKGLRRCGWWTRRGAASGSKDTALESPRPQLVRRRAEAGVRAALKLTGVRLVEGLRKNKARGSKDPRGRALGLQGRGDLEGTGWAALPGPRVRLSQQPVWLRSQGRAGPGTVYLTGRCAGGKEIQGALLSSQTGCRPRELTRLGSRGHGSGQAPTGGKGP